MLKNLTGGALINYGPSLPTPDEAYDGALFYKSTGADKGLYIFSFTQDADINAIGDQVVQNWSLVVGVNYVKTTGDTINGVLTISNGNSGAGFGTGENFLIIQNNSNSSGYSGIGFRKGDTGINAQVLEIGSGTGNGKLMFSTANAGVLADRMVIDSFGNVSIGTTATSRTLTVNGGIRALNGGPIEVDTGMITTNAPTNPLIFGVNGIEKMRIDNTGNVGIGRIPASNVRLSILGSGNSTEFGGNAEFRISSNNQLITTVYSWNQIATSGSDLLIGVAGSERLRVRTDGEIRIGNSTAISFNPADSTLTGVIGSQSLADYFVIDTNKIVHHYSLAWKSLSDIGGATAALLSGYSGIRLYTGGAERARVNQNGDVCINTTTVRQKLNVAGGVSILSGNFEIVGGGQLTTNDVSQPLILGVNAAEKVRVVSSGNVGIGETNPQGRLTAAGTDQLLRLQHDNAFISFMNTANNSRTGFIQFNAAGPTVFAVEANQPLVFNTNAAERVRIDSSGNVSIGTTSTARTLTVNGGIRTLGSHFELDTGQLTTSSVNYPLKLGVDGVERMWILSNGNVGIDVASPQGRLAISGSDELLRLQNNSAYIAFINSANSARTGFIQFNSGSPSFLMVEIGQDFVIGTGATERLRIGSGGTIMFGSPGAQMNLNNFFSRSEAGTGYQMLPGGIMFQWGVTGSLAADSGGNNISFPTAFSSACWHVSVNPSTNYGPSGTTVNAHGFAHSYTRFGFIITNDANAATFTWFAVGI